MRMAATTYAPKTTRGLLHVNPPCGGGCRRKSWTRTSLRFTLSTKDALVACAQATEDGDSPGLPTPQPALKANPEYTVTIKKPLSIVLAEKQSTKEVYIEEITAGGNADATGLVKVGDVVSKTSAIVLKSGREGRYQQEGYGQRVYDNWETIEFDCSGQDFDTVMAAIGSNNERWGIKTVTLTLRRGTN